MPTDDGLFFLDTDASDKALTESLVAAESTAVVVAAESAKQADERETTPDRAKSDMATMSTTVTVSEVTTAASTKTSTVDQTGSTTMPVVMVDVVPPSINPFVSLANVAAAGDRPGRPVVRDRPTKTANV